MALHHWKTQNTQANMAASFMSCVVQLPHGYCFPVRNSRYTVRLLPLATCDLQLLLQLLQPSAPPWRSPAMEPMFRQDSTTILQLLQLLQRQYLGLLEQRAVDCPAELSSGSSEYQITTVAKPILAVILIAGPHPRKIHATYLAQNEHTSSMAHDHLANK